MLPCVEAPFLVIGSWITPTGLLMAGGLARHPA